MKLLLTTTALALSLITVSFAEDTNVKTTKTNRETPGDAAGKGKAISPTPGENKGGTDVTNTKTTKDTPVAPAAEGTAKVKDRKAKKKGEPEGTAPAKEGTDVKNTKTTKDVPNKEGDPAGKPVNPNPEEGKKPADVKNSKTTK